MILPVAVMGSSSEIRFRGDTRGGQARANELLDLLLERAAGREAGLQTIKALTILAHLIRRADDRGHGTPGV